ncbi:MAG: DUF4198 domain-containing protein [Desulfovibrio sp.]|nr:DUF4198 domain-containing protein [Desulfovibrio sp.]
MPRHLPLFFLYVALLYVLCATVCIMVPGCLVTQVYAQVTLLVPSQPSIEAPSGKTAPRDEKRPEAATKADKQATPLSNPAGQNEAEAAMPVSGERPVAPLLDEEVDVLITMMHPFRNEGLDMDRPQLLAVLRYDDATPINDNVYQPERRDLLGDVEEIRYMNHRAWGANVALPRPGLYQFVIEGRPWWDAAHQCFLRHYVKNILPVYGVEFGWSLPCGQHLEIVPRTRPFGLMAPVLFMGTALQDGSPLASVPVRMVRINIEKQSVPTPWHEELTARTNAQGEFSFVLNQTGWWCCMADVPGDPLKGPDGQPKPQLLSALLWLYVDGPTEAARKH